MWQDMCNQHLPSFQFYRLNQNELDDALRNRVQYPILQLEEYDGEFKKSMGGAKFIDKQDCAILVLDKIKVEDYNSEHAQLNDLKAWAAQFFAKILHDNLLQIYCPNDIISLDENSIKYYLTDTLIEHVRGWRIEFTLLCQAKEMNYDNTQWQP